jgi:hypothetical protein
VHGGGRRREEAHDAGEPDGGSDEVWRTRGAGDVDGPAARS